jgi:hypothetical protein
LASLVALVLFGFSAYRAFSIRRSFSIGLYRRQALWAGILCAIFVMSYTMIALFGYSILKANTPVDFAVSFFQDLLILGMFAWIDATALVSRRADPLLRDPIRWTRIRRPVWAVVIASLVAAYYFTISGALSGGSLALAPSPAVLVALLVILLVPFTSGAILIPLSASRSGDVVFRRHLRWLGLLVIAILAVALLFGVELAYGTATGFVDLLLVAEQDPISNLLLVVIILATSYFAYRCVQSLVPINRLET